MASEETRLTPARQRVLSLLREAKTPLRAYELIARFRDGGGHTHPPTVYRALHYLQRRGLVHRVTSLNAYILCESRAAHTPGAVTLLICQGCGDISEPAPVDMVEARHLLDLQGFQLRSLSVEGRGLCRLCQA